MAITNGSYRRFRCFPNPRRRSVVRKLCIFLYLNSNVQFARAISSFKGDEEGQVQLKKGDVIHVLREFPNGWAAGLKNDEESGFFPKSYITPIIPNTFCRQTTPPLFQSVESRSRGIHRETIKSKSSSSIHRSIQFVCLSF